MVRGGHGPPAAVGGCKRVGEEAGVVVAHVADAGREEQQALREGRRRVSGLSKHLAMGVGG